MRRGFTLLELLVVLFVMGLAVALVAPAILNRPPRPQNALKEALDAARETALRRAETVELEIAPNGAWTLYAAASPGEAPLGGSKLEGWSGGPITVLVSPTGTCGFRARSLAQARHLSLQPFTCDVAIR